MNPKTPRVKYSSWGTMVSYSTYAISIIFIIPCVIIKIHQNKYFTFQKVNKWLLILFITEYSAEKDKNLSIQQFGLILTYIDRIRTSIKTKIIVKSISLFIFSHVVIVRQEPFQLKLRLEIR